MALPAFRPAFHPAFHVASVIACLLVAGLARADDDLLRYLPANAHAEREAPTPVALEQQIAARSDRLFDAIFAHCDADIVADATTGDFEFHHDHWGTIADTREAFVARIRAQCADIASGREPGTRRESVPGTQTIYPSGADGAMETGVHRFYQRNARGGETLVGIARYVHLWRRESGTWRIARILSYAHMDVTMDASATPRATAR